MSANEIIAELPKLSRQELEKVDCRVHELLQASNKTVWEGLLEIAGSAEGLPQDLPQQHDHYLHGTPKR
jgi:hypothetical protein